MADSPTPGTLASTPRLRIGVLVASTRAGRFAPVIRDWFMSRAATRPELDFDLLDLAELGLPPVLFGDDPDGAAPAFRARLAAADAFVVITPEYNHSYPAAFKHAFDMASTEWNAKPFAFVSYGGVSGGLRAVEHLRQVVPERHGMSIRDQVSFHMASQLFDEEGTLREPDGANTAADLMLTELAWWATALRNARTTTPYPV